MTEQNASNASESPKTTKRDMIFRAASPTSVIWLVGGALLLWGLEWPTNWLLTTSGLAIILLAYFLESRTRFGQEGPIILKEEATFTADGKIEKLRYGTSLFSHANFLRIAGIATAACGVLWPLNWPLMLTGFGLVAVGVYLMGQRRSRSGLDLVSEKFPTIGDEVRSEKGYVVRRVKQGIQYTEGGHTLTLGSKQATIDEYRVSHSDGRVKSQKVVTINV